MTRPFDETAARDPYGPCPRGDGYGCKGEALPLELGDSDGDGVNRPVTVSPYPCLTPFGGSVAPGSKAAALSPVLFANCVRWSEASRRICAESAKEFWLAASRAPPPGPPPVKKT